MNRYSILTPSINYSGTPAISLLDGYREVVPSRTLLISVRLGDEPFRVASKSFNVDIHSGNMDL